MPFLVIYKNCYGLSIMKYFEGLTTQKYSYKICYGLSSRKLYKNCYGLSINNCVEPNFRDALSYKNCYGLSFSVEALYQLQI